MWRCESTAHETFYTMTSSSAPEWTGAWSFTSLHSVIYYSRSSTSPMMYHYSSVNSSAPSEIQGIGGYLTAPPSITNPTAIGNPIVTFAVNSNNERLFYTLQEDANHSVIYNSYNVGLEKGSILKSGFSGFGGYSNNGETMYVAIGPADRIDNTYSAWFSTVISSTQFSPALSEDSSQWGPPVDSTYRVVLNYQPPEGTVSFNGQMILTPSDQASPYNGIYTPSISITYYNSNREETKEDSQKYYAKVTIYWRRTVDADTWGELLNKIVMVNPDNMSSGNWAGQNVQINVESENNNGGVLNTTPFKFVAEKPIKLYELDETDNPDINKTAIIFYNNPTDTDKEIIPANTLFLKPLNNLENGNIIKFAHPQYDIWGVLSNIDVVVWSAQVDMKVGVYITYSSNPVGTSEVEYNNPTYIPTYAGSVTLAAPSRIGYTFDNWSPSDTIAQGTLGNIVLTANWNRNEYTLLFDSNGGSVPSPASKTVRYDMRYSTSVGGLPGVTKNGYSFAGWYITVDNSVFKLKEKNGVWRYDVNSPITAYAHWDINTYDIQYELNGGQVIDGNPTTYTVEDPTIYIIQPTKRGYDFMGWIWEDQEEPTTSATIPHGSYGNKTFVANWDPIVINVRFSVQGGGNIPDPMDITYDTHYTLPPTTRTGYNFAYWSYDGREFPSEGIWNQLLRSMTLVANWTPRDDTPYTIRYYQENAENDDYTLYEEITAQGTTGTSVTLRLPDYVGFVTPQAPTATIAADGSTVIECYYTRMKYKLYFCDNTGIMSGENAQWYYKETKYQKHLTAGYLGTPTRAGYTFGGWYYGIFLDTLATSTYMPNQDTYIYAWWSNETKTNLFTWQDHGAYYTLSGRNGESGTPIGESNTIRIPSYIRGLPVREIAANALRDQCPTGTSSVIKTVYAPRELQKIGNYAFYNSRVETFWMPTTVNDIGYRALNGNSLVPITAPLIIKYEGTQSQFDAIGFETDPYNPPSRLQIQYNCGYFD